MCQKSEIVFFVFGLESKSKGLYLVRVLKTYPGIYKVIFDFNSRTLKVRYNPEIISLNTIRKLSYFKECLFLSDQREIEVQIELLKKRRVWRSLVNRGLVISLVLLVYLMIKILFMDKHIHWSFYLVFVIVTFLIIIGNYFQRKILKEINSKKKIYYRIYNRVY